MKYIFKNIWSHRGLNTWLFLEIVIISVLTWLLGGSIVDDFYRKVHYSCSSVIDTDNMLRAYVARYITGYDEVHGLEEHKKNIPVVMEKLREVPEFETATYECNMYIGTKYKKVFNADNGISSSVCGILVIPGSNYFSTMNIESLNHNYEMLEECVSAMGDDETVISESLATALFGTADVVGRFIYVAEADKYVHPDSVKNTCTCMKIADVVTNRLLHTYDIFGYSMYTKGDIGSQVDEGMSPIVAIRLRNGMTADEFLANRNLQADRETFSSGNTHIDKFKPYIDYGAGSGGADVTILGIFLVLFFIDMFIGISGTFWLQIRNRIKDISVQRSFGASRRRVMRSIVAEGMVLAQIAVLVGAVVVLQLPYNYSAPIAPYFCTGLETNWMVNYWPHFFIIFAITSVVIQIFVVIGTLIPAYFHTRKLLEK